MKILFRLISNENPKFSLLEKNFEYDEWWGMFVLETELDERPDIWGLLDEINKNDYELDDSLDIRQDWYEYTYIICGELCAR